MGTDSNNKTGGGAAYSRFAEEMDIDSVDLSIRMSLTKQQRLKAICLDNWRVLLVLLISLLCFGIGLILGHFIAASCEVESAANGKHVTTQPNWTGSQSTGSGSDTTHMYAQHVHDMIQAGHLQSNLRDYTSGAHHAGSPDNLEKANDIYNMWKGYQFDVEKKNYTVLLSRPDKNNRNKIQIFNSKTHESIWNLTLDDGADSPMLPPFAVYGSNASITTPPVYVNFATRENFKFLRDLTGVQVEGCTCIARLGKIPLAQMTQISFDHKCSGLIAFRDPSPFANPKGTEPAKSYPNTWWLPGGGIPRETTRLTMGDPSSPFFPSHDWIPRQSPSSLLQGFPVQTISYDDAKRLFALMKYVPARDPNWMGGFLDYNVGPGFHNTDYAMRFEVNNRLAMANITNVIGTIEGTTEPDRYVIIGSHRDSLSYGVVSPGTGTACLMEVAKVLSELMKQGWRPRRTIILASWDAGEDGSIGSTEWIEENLERLRWRGVAYINLDDAVTGNYSFAAAGSPLLAKVIFQATMNVDCPDSAHSDMTIYHNWANRRPVDASSNKPRVDPLGQSSDAAPFLMLAGVPSLDLQYTYDEDYYVVPRYPTYQTAFDKKENINVFIDPDFAIHAALTEVVVKALITLADTPKLTMDLTHYADSLTRYVQQFKTQYGPTLAEQGMSLDRLEFAVRNFSTAAQTFQSTFNAMDENDELTLREMNDHVLAVERAFLLNGWISTNPETRHLIYSGSTKSVYKGAVFGLLAQMIAIQVEVGDWTYVDQTLGYTTLGLQAATGILSDAQLH